MKPVVSASLTAEPGREAYTLEDEIEGPKPTPGEGFAAPQPTTRDIFGEKRKNPIIAFYAAGLGVMFLLFTASGASGALLEESENGTLDRVLSSRVSMTTLLLGKLLLGLLRTDRLTDVDVDLGCRITICSRLFVVAGFDPELNRIAVVQPQRRQRAAITQQRGEMARASGTGAVARHTRVEVFEGND